MSLLRPTLERRQGDELVAHVVASAGAIWFRGHFPVRPILPGVAILATVADAIARFWPDGEHPAVEIRALHRVRFRQIIDPGTNLRIRVRQVEADRLRFTVEALGLPIASGDCLTAVSERPVAGAAAPDLLDPVRPSARFCSDGTTVAAILDQAGRLCRLRSAEGPATICVASEDRALVAAALLAALSGGPAALLPPALTADAMLATFRLRRFSHWLGPEAWRSQVPADFTASFVDLADGAAPAPRGLRPSDEPCVFLHTGGSTGTPRSWAKTARNLLEEVATHVRGLQVDPEDHILATVPPHHIYGLLFSVLLPLRSGATVERTSPFFPQEIAERIAATSASILVSTPAHLKALANVMTGPHRLRLVLSSGAPLSAADAQGFFFRTGLWPLEVYGSTETGGIALRRQDVAEAPWHPLPGVACRLDGDLLAVRSAFTSSDVSVDGDGFFRTADLATLRPDGSFDLGGRADGVVKVGGVRVLLPEIEKAILALGQVADAVVLALPSDSGRGQDIVALVASVRPAEEILRELRGVLPSASWPRRLRTVDSIPTTPSGKRDRSVILDLLEAAGGDAPSC
jgi:acyl-CoA synthetase (AMP-forming)/AMP-acid ligase II